MSCPLPHDPADVLHEDIGSSSLWTRVNIAEACPGVPTPLTWSWFGYGSDVGVSRGWVRMGVLPAWRGERQHSAGDRMVSIHAGHPVLNLGILREIGGSIPGSSAQKVERQFFASDTAIEPGPTLWRRYPTVAVKLVPAVLRARRELLAQVPTTLAWWSESVAELAAPDCAPARARALLAEAFDRYLPLTTLQTINSLSVSGLYDLLVKLCERHRVADQAGALSTSDDLTPEAMTVQDLWRLSRGSIELAEFLGRHGYHAPVQGELAVSSWRMDPAPVLKLAESYRRRGDADDPVSAHQRLRATRDDTERQLLSSVSWGLRPAVRALLGAVRGLVPMREVARLQFMQCADVARAAANVLGAHLSGEGRLEAPDEVYQLTGDELIGDLPVAPGVTALRRERREAYLGLDLPMRFVGYPEVSPVAVPGGPDQARRLFTGLSGSRGVYEGRARVIAEPDDADELLDGEILVCETTNPSWASYFLVAGAVVVDIGGPLSHGPIVAREMGIPCVINTRDARLVIASGDMLRVDGTEGVVEIFEPFDVGTDPVEREEWNVSVKPGADDPEITNFHYWNPEVQHDPNPFFDKLRSGCPVAWSDRYEGFWVLSKYDDVYRAYQEPNTFSSYPNPIPAEGMGNARAVIPVEIDPPDHTAYREILAPLFTAHRIRPLEAKIQAHARELVAGIKAKGGCNYASEFAKVLPTRVFLDMMGWPMSDAPMFLDWCDKLMRDIPGDPDGTQKQKLETGMALYGYFGAELAKRADTEPLRGDDADFIDWLRSATFKTDTVEPRPLDTMEILDCIFIVLLAGLDTTQGVLSLSMEYLANNPEYRQDLLDNPDVLPSAVEEFLRWFAPVLPGRRMTKDVELRGVTLKEGDRVMLGMGSACRDADEFEDAGTVDFRRKPNRHIAFGVGAHRCLGSHLARLELQISLREWHREIPEYEVPEGAVLRKHLSAVRGVDELPIVVL